MAITFIATDYDEWINLASIIYFKVDCIRENQQYELIAYGAYDKCWHISSHKSAKQAEKDLIERIQG